MSPRAGAVRMIDVASKAPTRREAVALAELALSARTLGLVRDSALPKGDALAAARVAGILAAKRVPDLIPLCHPLPLESAEVGFRLEPGRLVIRAVARAQAKTGVEMEALAAAAVAALTVYDMVKSLEPGAAIGPVRLVRKSGGKSDFGSEGDTGEWL